MAETLLLKPPEESSLSAETGIGRTPDYSVEELGKLVVGKHLSRSCRREREPEPVILSPSGSDELQGPVAHKVPRIDADQLRKIFHKSKR